MVVFGRQPDNASSYCLARSLKPHCAEALTLPQAQGGASGKGATCHQPPFASRLGASTLRRSVDPAEGSFGGLLDTMERPEPRRNPWPAMSRPPPKPMHSTEPPSNYIQRLGINNKILGMRQVAAPNIEPSDLSLSESDRLRSKVRCFGSAFPGGTIAEASKVELGACAVLKPRSPVLTPPNAAIPSPEESAARDGRLVWGIVRYNGKADAWANALACHVETFSEANALVRATLKLHTKIGNQCQNYRNATSGRPKHRIFGFEPV